jgi:hypothetical protein
MNLNKTLYTLDMNIGYELEKIAFIGGMLRGGMNTLGNFFRSPSITNSMGKAKQVVGDALHAGWHGTDRAGVALPGGKNNWFGAKGLNTAFTAMQVPSALSSEDETGQGRSRAERIGTLAAGQIGNIAGGSLTAGRNLGRVGNFVAPLAGGLLGQGMAEKAVSIPFKPFRSGTKPMPGQVQPQTQSSTENLQLTNGIKN